MNLNRADLPLLASLSVLLEEANVTRAAARLHISQPALSAQLARLREVLGDPLLVPSETGRGMVPTERARMLQQPLREALVRLDALVGMHEGFDPAGADYTFRIAADDNASALVGIGLLRRLAEAGPGLRLAFHDVAPAAATRALERGEIDVLLCSRRAVPAGLAWTALFEDRLRVAQRKGHPRGRGPIDLAAYCAGRHVVVSPKGAFEGPIDAELARLALRRRVVATVPNHALVPPALAATDCFCTLPARFLACHAHALDHFPLPLDVPGVALAMAWHPRSEQDAAQRWLRACLAEEARGFEEHDDDVAR